MSNTQQQAAAAAETALWLRPCMQQLVAGAAYTDDAKV
jgi:hypothetical protein